MTSCVVTRNGNSETVVLPAAWRKSNHVEAGDVLDADLGVEGQITFRVRKKDPATATDRLIAFVESLPRIPWDGTGEPADDKRILEERYE